MLNVYVAPACVCGVKTVRPAGTSGTLETAFENFLLYVDAGWFYTSSCLHALAVLHQIINRGMGSPAPHRHDGP